VGPAQGRLTVATAGANLLAGVLLGAAYVSVRNEAVLARQVGGLELAALAAVVAIAADLGHIVATYRAVVTGRRWLSGIALTSTGADRSSPAPAARPLNRLWPLNPLPAPASPAVALPAGTLVHHPACALVGGKNAEALAPGALTARRLRPCPVCRP
jgi:hypothetical protein